MVNDVSGKATIQLYVKYNTTTLYRSNCEYNQSLKSFVTISLIFQSLLNILLIESHILIPLFFARDLGRPETLNLGAQSTGIWAPTVQTVGAHSSNCG